MARERAPLSSSLAPQASAGIGEYQVFASLGRGGHVDVYLGLSRGGAGGGAPERLAILKRLRGDLGDPSLAAALLDEARLAVRLRHPNLAVTYEVGETNGAYFVASEFLEGQSLEHFARRAAATPRPLEQALVARIAADALAGIHAAHELRDDAGAPANLVHRDMGPHAIFLTYDGAVKGHRLRPGEGRVDAAGRGRERSGREPLRGARASAVGRGRSARGRLRDGDRALGAARRRASARRGGRAVVGAADRAAADGARVVGRGERGPAAGRDRRAGAGARSIGALFRTAEEMRGALEGYLAAIGLGGRPMAGDIARRLWDLFADVRQLRRAAARAADRRGARGERRAREPHGGARVRRGEGRQPGRAIARPGAAPRRGGRGARRVRVFRGEARDGGDRVDRGSDRAPRSHRRTDGGSLPSPASSAPSPPPARPRSKSRPRPRSRGRRAGRRGVAARRPKPPPL